MTHLFLTVSNFTSDSDLQYFSVKTSILHLPTQTQEHNLDKKRVEMIVSTLCLNFRALFSRNIQKRNQNKQAADPAYLTLLLKNNTIFALKFAVISQYSMAGNSNTTKKLSTFLVSYLGCALMFYSQFRKPLWRLDSLSKSHLKVRSPPSITVSHLSKILLL